MQLCENVAPPQIDPQQAAIDSLNSLTTYGDGQFYSMDCTVDYKLDEVLEAEPKSEEDFTRLMSETVMNGRAVELLMPENSCSAFTAITGSGERIMGRSFNLSESVVPLVVIAAPKQGYRSISTVNLETVGFSADIGIPAALEERYAAVCAPYLPLDGMNEQGLCVSALYLDGNPTRQNTGKKKIYTTLAVRALLDKAATVDEAIELLSAYDIQSAGDTGSYHYLIGDASGRTVVVEYPNNRMHVMEANACTNFYLCNGFGHGHDRYKAIRSALVRNRGVISEEGAMNIMGSASQLLIQAKADQAQWLIVYNMNDLTAKTVFEVDYRSVYEFALFHSEET